MNNFPEAEKYLVMAMDVSNEIGDKTALKNNYLNFSLFYEKQKKYNEAYAIHLKYDRLKESLENAETKRQLRNIEELQQASSFELKLNLKDQQIKMLKGEKHASFLKNIYISSSLILVLIIILVYIRKQRLVLKKEKEIREMKERVQNEREITLKSQLKNTQQELTYKNKELINFGKQIVTKNNLLTSMNRELMTISKSSSTKEELTKELIKLARLIKSRYNMDHERKEFEQHLKLISEGFFQKLTELFPDISDNDKRLAALIRLDLSSKEIATILNISSKTVDLYRHNLRQKVNLPSNQNLKSFLNEI